MKELGDSGLQVAGWSIDVTVHDENITIGNIYTKNACLSWAHLAQILNEN